MKNDTMTHEQYTNKQIHVQVLVSQHTSAYVCIRQHTSAYVSIRQHTLIHVEVFVIRKNSIHQHTSAYVSIRMDLLMRQGVSLQTVIIELEEETETLKEELQTSTASSTIKKHADDLVEKQLRMPCQMYKMLHEVFRVLHRCLDLETKGLRQHAGRKGQSLYQSPMCIAFSKIALHRIGEKGNRGGWAVMTALL
jgi:hypothetical protein